MIKLMLVFLFVSCAKVPVKDDLVSVDAALNHAQASYLKGCVDAKKELKVSPAFEGCNTRAKNHRNEIEAILNQEPL